jgi:uncharacterized NAD-dependent epimerase/dehydratase family protein
MSPVIPAGARLAVLMDDHLQDPGGKMGHGVLRYSRHEVVAVVAAPHVGGDLPALTGIPRPVPIVADAATAAGLGADVAIVGYQGGGGRLVPGQRDRIVEAVDAGMSVVAGLHDRLAADADLTRRLRLGQRIVDLRVEPPSVGVATGRSAVGRGRRVVTVGTDMAQGKMTAALEMQSAAVAAGIPVRFLATGQIGICVSGSGVALDAVRVDYAAGAVEQMVVDHPDDELLLVEGQGSVVHPGSTAWLPIVRGASPTHLILTHRAGQDRLHRIPEVRIPPLPEVIATYEQVAALPGLTRPRVAGIALNCAHLDDDAARAAVAEVEAETGLPTVDPVRHGAATLVDAVMAEEASALVAPAGER